jgi:bla regulator protein blaR1
MTIYIFKMVLCSAILLLFYHFFLEREKMHRFNRFYLLFSIAFSFLVPLITIGSGAAMLPVQEVIIVANNGIENTFATQGTQRVSDERLNYLLIFYLAISAFFLLRFIINTCSLLYKTTLHRTVSYSNAKLVLIKEKLMPHTYLDYIFLNKEDYEQEHIEPEILNHELTHVRQKHTADIILAELAIVLAV